MDLKKDFNQAALHSGDRQEFSRLVEEYSGPMYRLALRMLGNQQDAEDVLQNTFMKAFEHISGFEGRSSLSTWLYRIASNEALMKIRKKNPEVTFTDVEKEDDEDSDPFPSRFTDWGSLPEEELLSGESRSALDLAVSHLPESLRVVFVLRDIEGLSIQETGDVLKLSESAVKTRLLRARLRLREELSGYYGERMQKGGKHG